MATNCPQQVKPRAWRSAWCLRTAVSNSQRENNPRILDKMLQNRFTAEPPKSLIGSARTQSQLSRGSAFSPPILRFTIWTSLTLDSEGPDTALLASAGGYPFRAAGFFFFFLASA